MSIASAIIGIVSAIASISTGVASGVSGKRGKEAAQRIYDRQQKYQKKLNRHNNRLSAMALKQETQKTNHLVEFNKKQIGLAKRKSEFDESNVNQEIMGGISANLGGANSKLSRTAKQIQQTGLR